MSERTPLRLTPDQRSAAIEGAKKLLQDPTLGISIGPVLLEAADGAKIVPPELSLVKKRRNQIGKPSFNKAELDALELVLSNGVTADKSAVGEDKLLRSLIQEQRLIIEQTEKIQTTRRGALRLTAGVVVAGSVAAGMVVLSKSSWDERGLIIADMRDSVGQAFSRDPRHLNGRKPQNNDEAMKRVEFDRDVQAYWDNLLSQNNKVIADTIGKLTVGIIGSVLGAFATGVFAIKGLFRMGQLKKEQQELAEIAGD